MRTKDYTKIGGWLTFFLVVFGFGGLLANFLNLVDGALFSLVTTGSQSLHEYPLEWYVSDILRVISFLLFAWLLNNVTQKVGDFRVYAIIYLWTYFGITMVNALFYPGFNFFIKYPELTSEAIYTTSPEILTSLGGVIGYSSDYYGHSIEVIPIATAVAPFIVFILAIIWTLYFVFSKRIKGMQGKSTLTDQPSNFLKPKKLKADGVDVIKPEQIKKRDYIFKKSFEINYKKLFYGLIISVILVIAGYLTYSDLFKTPEEKYNEIANSIVGDNPNNFYYPDCAILHGPATTSKNFTQLTANKQTQIIAFLKKRQKQDSLIKLEYGDYIELNPIACNCGEYYEIKSEIEKNDLEIPWLLYHYVNDERNSDIKPCMDDLFLPAYRE